MKKIVSCILVIILALSATLAFAETAKNNSVVLSSYAYVDPDVAYEVLDAFKIDEASRKIVEPALAVINAANDKLTIAENGIEYRLFLNETELLSCAGGMNDEGLIIISNLIPGNALTLSNKTIEVATATASLMTELYTSLIKKEKQDSAPQQNYQALVPYVEKFLNEMSSAIIFGELEHGYYELLDHSYNAMMPISIDAQIFTNAWTNMISEIKKDETVMTLLNMANVTVEGIENISEITDLLPSIRIAVYAITDDNGAETDPAKCFSFSITQPGQKNTLASFNLHVLEDHFDAELHTQAKEDGSSNSAVFSFAPFAYSEETKVGGGELAIDVDGKYYAIASALAPNDDSTAMILSDTVYILNSDAPLLTTVTLVEAGEAQKLDLSLGDRVAVPIESLSSKESKDVIENLQTNVIFSALGIMSTATKAVPEVADLIEILSTSGTAETK
jgi:hypothetical protein